MKQIPLTQGKVAIVDDEDYEALIAYKWHAVCHKRGRPSEVWYAMRSVSKRQTLSMHRQILPASRGLRTAHKNHDGLDNRRDNLAVASRSKITGASRTVEGKLPRGVYHIDMYRAAIRVDRQYLNLGMFKTVEDAEEAYKTAQAKHFTLD